MSKKSLFDIVREIYKLLKKEGELSIQSIAHSIRSNWDTTRRTLEFMEEFGIVKEREGRESYRKERRFSLVQKN